MYIQYLVTMVGHTLRAEWTKWQQEYIEQAVMERSTRGGPPTRGRAVG